MLTSVLVANRGEIARRVIATARRMDLTTVAVYSDADAGSRHVTEADVAVHLPGTAAADTYLRGDRLVRAAQVAGAEAVHPGYGFLAESAEFAREVQAVGLCWLGPAPDTIERMGSKVEAKKLMADAGVPVLTELDPTDVTPQQLPVVVKASAGGGGRGMRVVHDAAHLEAEIAAARREARSAFGDATVFCERYLTTGHHVEVQVLADQHGTVWALGERECSIQRRHQKIIEEAPSPLVERIPGLRERLFEAARLAAKAVGYEGAGTVEFLADEHGAFYFLEMNTRLQVEHPVTECNTGLDLVREQIHIAEGNALAAEPPQPRGHAVEARLYAEDPARDWQPHTGRVHRLHLSEADGEFTPVAAPGIRLDSGVHDGFVVTPHYDPMLAKVIAYAETRHEALRMLSASLARATIHGPVTNRDLLVRVLRHPAFHSGDTDTAFLNTHDLARLAQPLAEEHATRVAAAAAALTAAVDRHHAGVSPPGVPIAWRNLPAEPRQRTFIDRGGTEITVSYWGGRDGLRVSEPGGIRVASVSSQQADLDLESDGDSDRTCVRVTCTVHRYGDLVCVDSPLGPVTLTEQPRFTDPTQQLPTGSLLAPMPGTVTRHAAEVGQRLERGQPVLWLEAMKMEHTIAAPATGVLTELPVATGQPVDVNQVLAVVQPDPAAATDPSPDSEESA
ncbi:biotin carboxylase N-terminal domain-containing protein [Lipingzhangella sp. LS1_29]|uniref:Biotin carboxylase N-terminal domain-containing protein n=1 Tax=Lipingzhangella rawalii TaxID=2055835 RepID=A0ABU2H5D9_9ACTN|nr:biotin carboxylase N-terminal domain-containing protein [Lipingzhangella rawalii]MDS1270522.1 biotin carboxylase N-terminal domain-containing protein [Lipingzhangella rawalii]